MMGWSAVENPASPSDEKRDSAERGDCAEFTDVGQCERIKAAGEEDNSGQEPVITERTARLQGDHEQGEAVDEVIKGRRFPVVEASRCFEAPGETVGTECTQSDPEENDERGKTEA